MKEFGLLTLVNTFDLVAFVISGGLILQAMQKYAAEVTGSELNDLVVNSAFLYCLLSLIPALAIAFFSSIIADFLHAPSLSNLLKLLPILTISHWARRLAYYILLAKEKLFEVFIIDFIPFLIMVVLIISLFSSNKLDTALTVLIVRIISDFGATVVSVKYLKKEIKFNLNINRAWIGKLVSFGKYSFGSTMGNLIHMRVDTLMISYFYDPLILAAYSSARGISEFLRNFVQAANMIVLPRASKLFSKSDLTGVRTIYYKGIVYSLILVLPIALILIIIPNFILFLAYGNKYLDSVNILRLFAICSLISPIGTIGSSVSSGIGKPNYVFVAMCLSVIINVCLNLILIPKYGAIGAAYSTLAALIVGGITITSLIHKKINLSIKEFDKSFLDDFFVWFKINR